MWHLHCILAGSESANGAVKAGPRRHAGWREPDDTHRKRRGTRFPRRRCGNLEVQLRVAHMETSHSLQHVGAGAGNALRFGVGRQADEQPRTVSNAGGSDEGSRAWECATAGCRICGSMSVPIRNSMVPGGLKCTGDGCFRSIFLIHRRQSFFLLLTPNPSAQVRCRKAFKQDWYDLPGAPLRPPAPCAFQTVGFRCIPRRR